MKRIAASLALALILSASANAETAEDFYRGKTINILIGFSAGGGYDLYARLLSRHLGRHMPGNPTVVAQNMPGAGSLKAALNVYSVAPTAAAWSPTRCSSARTSIR
jgi:tripartite-type tricarboxylate transporter receptor subunit TctC